MTQPGLLVFVDSNVLIEALFLPWSAAAAVIDLAINNKLQKIPEDLDTVVPRWEALKTNSRLAVIADEPLVSANRIYHDYMKFMRHKADIPILAAAIKLNPDAILSGNREHFNDAVAHKSGIRICSCADFLNLIAQHKTD